MVSGRAGSDSGAMGSAGVAAAEARMNAAAVRRVDPYARDIVETCSHVALYCFDENEWTKTEVEGALFVYSRSGRPYHNILVMNRLSTHNLIEPVTHGLELQLQEPFLLYRNSKRRIYGLWFYDKDECARVAAKINKLVREQADEPGAAPVPDSVDIFSMLTKAQDDYNSHKQPPRAPDLASQSVMEFFAKAGGGSQLPAQSAPPAALFGVARPPDMSLQRLMSDPVRSVEHIEKQQRSVTPRGEQPDKQRVAADHKSKTPSGESKRKNKSDASKVQTPTAPPKMNARQISKPIDVPSASRSNGQLLESDMRLLSLSPQYPAKSVDDAPESVAAPPGPVQETPQKPALMPPTMFTSSATKVTAERPAMDNAATPIKPVPVELRPEPLTRNQLLQALNYLIKNDADFMTKLHEAYVKSFSELVS